MMLEVFLLILTVMALVLGYASCIAMVLKLYRAADALIACAWGLAGSMLLASLVSAYALIA
jgi:hypothetical protein